MKAQPIEVSVDGQVLRGTLHKPSSRPKKVAFLFLHGWTGKSNDDAAALLANNGFYAMTINLRGHNTSDGDIKTVSRRDSLADVLAAYDFFKQQVPKGISIGVIGNSYGGYMAALLSHERPVSCLSLRVPANYQDESFEQAQWGKGADDPAVLEWRNQPLDFSETKALRAIHSFKGPIQLLEAEHDERIPSQTLKNYHRAITHGQLDYHLMKGWPHSLGMDKARNQQFQALLLDWAEQREKQV